MTTDDLATKLAEMIANLSDHIDQKAWEVAEPRIQAAHEAARAEVDDVKLEAAMEKRRSGDLVVELRRQIAALERQIPTIIRCSPSEDWTGPQDGDR